MSHLQCTTIGRCSGLTRSLNARTNLQITMLMNMLELMVVLIVGNTMIAVSWQSLTSWYWQLVVARYFVGNQNGHNHEIFIAMVKVMPKLIFSSSKVSKGIAMQLGT